MNNKNFVEFHEKKINDSHGFKTFKYVFPIFTRMFLFHWIFSVIHVFRSENSDHTMRNELF